MIALEQHNLVMTHIKRCCHNRCMQQDIFLGLYCSITTPISRLVSKCANARAYCLLKSWDTSVRRELTTKNVTTYEILINTVFALQNCQNVLIHSVVNLALPMQVRYSFLKISIFFWKCHTTLLLPLNYCLSNCFNKNISNWTFNYSSSFINHTISYNKKYQWN